MSKVVASAATVASTIAVLSGNGPVSGFGTSDVPGSPRQRRTVSRTSGLKADTTEPGTPGSSPRSVEVSTTAAATTAGCRMEVVPVGVTVTAAPG